MIFNFKESLKDLYDFVLDLTVNNSKRMRSDALIGHFKLDLGNVYDQQGNAKNNKDREQGKLVGNPIYYLQFDMTRIKTNLSISCASASHQSWLAMSGFPGNPNFMFKHNYSPPGVKFNHTISSN